MGRNIESKEVGIIEEWHWWDYGRGRRVFLLLISGRTLGSREGVLNRAGMLELRL
jgi:hypothetical protein